jgi:Flp pilus assembly protein TadG
MIRRPHVPSTIGRGSDRRARCARGQSLVEFALLLPVLVILMMLAVDVGRVYFATVSLHNIARIGANYAAQSADAWKGTGNSTMQARYQALMRGDARGLDCQLPTTLPSPTFVDSGVNQYSLGSRVRVDVSCRFQLLSPFLYNIIGDANGGVQVRATTTFTIRTGSVESVVSGSATPTPEPTATVGPTSGIEPTPTPTATATPDPAVTPDPDATPAPTPSPTPELIVSFYGSSTSVDASGGGPPGSTDENQIVGVPPVVVTFVNTTQGLHGQCLWEFGDGATSTSCGNTVSRTYSTRGTFTVKLTVQDRSYTRTAYVLVGCKVPAFSGVRKDAASTAWTNAGFASGKLTTQSGRGNYRIGYQSLAGGLVNPPGGCSGATITVGP